MPKMSVAGSRLDRLKLLVSPALAVLGMLTLPGLMLASGRLSLASPPEQFLAAGLALCVFAVIFVGVWRALSVETQKPEKMK